MPEITRNFTVPEKGIGRKDYSINVEESTVPFTRSHQLRASTYGTYDLTPFSWATIDLEPFIGVFVIYDGMIRPTLDHLAYLYEIDFPDNVLIKAYFGLYTLATGILEPLQCKYGYGKVQFIFPKGYLIEKETLQSGVQPAFGFLPGGYWVKMTMSYLSEELA